jgi:ribosomal subunit interface protein
MKVNIRTLHIRETSSLREEIERQLASLQQWVPISAAHVLLGKYRGQNPPFSAAVHLEVPGPDIRAVESDHTLAAAFKKVADGLQERILLRHGHRRQKQKTRLKMRREVRSPCH